MSAIFWTYHLFWCLGKLYLALFRFDAKGAGEAFWCAHIHIMYKQKLVNKIRLPFKTEFKNYLTSVFGLFVSIALIVLIKHLLSVLWPW